jgi:ketosteroid isomerase-like protein
MRGREADAAAVRDGVRALTRAWRTKQLDLLPALFHERAVIVDVTHGRLAVGKEACVESYRAFVRMADVEAYDEGEPVIDLFESTAVVVYPFQMRYRSGGQSYTESGSDCLVWERGPQGWQVVWRQLVWRSA